MDPQRLVFRVHAIQRMFQRGITQQDVTEVLNSGDAVGEYPADQPYPSRLLLGWRGQRALHIVVADNSPSRELIIITVYEPGLDQWDPGFRTRRIS